MGIGPCLWMLGLGTQAGPALAGEGELTAGNCAADGAFCFGAEGLGSAELVQVNHRVAAFADEMHMWVGVGIEPFHSVDCGDDGHQSLLTEESQIPVDCADGQIRDLLFQIREDGFR